MVAPDLRDGLTRFLSEQWGRPVTLSGIGQSTAGARRTQILFQADDGERRLGLVATIVPTAAIMLNAVDAEAAVRTLAEEAGVPVPHIHGVCLDSSYVGGPFYLSALTEGESVPRRVLRLVEAEGIGTKVAAQIGDALARLHAVDWNLAPAGLVDPGPANPCETALAGAELSARGLLQPRPVFSLGLKWLEKRLPGQPARRAIIHSDVRNGNLIVSKDGLAAILDWEGSRRQGDPMEDCAWPSLRMWRFREDAKEIGGFAGVAPYRDAYIAAGGAWDEDRYRWWKVLGTLRWGLGLAGQSHQHLDGSFKTVVMAASGRRVSELEWDLLMLIRPR